VRTRSFIYVAAFLAVLVVLGGALYAYDHARANEIAPGVKVGGVALGGLTPDQARARLEREILQPLEQPIVVHHADKTWKLGPREARLRADLGAMVDEALARSRTGNIFARSWRSLRGERTNDDLQPTVQYSDAAVIRLLDKVRRSVERPAKDASVKIDAGGVRTIPGVEGLAVSASQLHRQIGAAITSTSASRTFVAKTRHT
jgi:vancomycin resistance protein YoaR